jgi:hypothetical protein
MLAIAGIATAAAAAPAVAAPDDLVARPLVLGEGLLELRLTTEINIERRRNAQPLSFAPDAWWGVAPRWMIGVIHSHGSLERIDTGASLCVRQGGVPGCSGPYRGGGLDVRFSAREGSLAVAPRLRLLVREIDPFKPAVTLGAVVRWTRGRFAIASEPYLQVPLANARRGNRTQLVIPLRFAVQPARRWVVGLVAGYDADVVVLRDGGHGPLGVFATARYRDVEVGLQVGWASVLGPQFDIRQAVVFVTAGWTVDWLR